MKDTVSHYIPPPNPFTSTAPQAFSNNLTMPTDMLASRVRWELSCKYRAKNKAIRERRDQFHAVVDQFSAKQLTVAL